MNLEKFVGRGQAAQSAANEVIAKATQPLKIVTVQKGRHYKPWAVISVDRKTEWFRSLRKAIAAGIERLGGPDQPHTIKRIDSGSLYITKDAA